MNIELTEKANPDWVATTRARNDAFRATLTGGAVLLTAGIVGLGAANQARIIDAVRRFTGFDDDDPFDAHDIGDLEVEIEEPGIDRWHELIFFKIDVIAGAPPAATCPASAPNSNLTLTIMLASEW